MTGAVGAPQWRYADRLLSQFGHNRAAARIRYAQFVVEGCSLPSPWVALKGQVLLGADGFVESLLPLIEKKGDLQEFPKA